MEENKNNHGQKNTYRMSFKKKKNSVCFLVNKPHFSKVF